MKREKITVSTKKDFDMVDLTDRVRKSVKKSGMKSGTVNVFVKGSTASVSTIEFEPNLVKDMKEALDRIAPKDRKYHHHETWGDHNGHAHVRSTLMGPDVTVPFEDGKLLTGTWQQIVLLDFDVPGREREIILTVAGE